MAINFPASLDTTTTLPNPTGTSTQASPDHASLHTNENVAIIAVETKVGTGASTPTNNNLLVGTGTGTSAWTKASPTGVIVGTTDSQTLTNKTLTTPTITAPIITNATLSSDNITGFTTSNSGTIYGVPITLGVIQNAGTVSGASLVASSVQTAALANTSVTASKLSTGAAYALVSTTQTTSSTTYTDLGTVGPAVTATIGTNGLALITFTIDAFNTVAGDYAACAVAISGATTRAAAAPYETLIQMPAAGTVEAKQSYSVVITALTPGSTTFTLKYRAIVGGTASFGAREISVVPL